MKESAGTLLYRSITEVIEVLIVRPSGVAARYGWSIPKGLIDVGESLEQAARRETREETGCEAGVLRPLGSVVYRSRSKRVHCFYGLAPESASPSCKSWEIDRAEFIPCSEAAQRLHADQREFIPRLLEALRSELG